ncbi:hypothetical protein C8Q76DRAFT_788979 [Earliella scabrosa]|nr:hypothetical protein C8Q76DRAFT_788979 [Earliella scabrosa]
MHPSPSANLQVLAFLVLLFVFLLFCLGTATVFASPRRRLSKNQRTTGREFDAQSPQDLASQRHWHSPQCGTESDASASCSPDPGSDGDSDYDYEKGQDPALGSLEFDAPGANACEARWLLPPCRPRESAFRRVRNFVLCWVRVTPLPRADVKHDDADARAPAQQDAVAPPIPIPTIVVHCGCGRDHQRVVVNTDAHVPRAGSCACSLGSLYSSSSSSSCSSTLEVWPSDSDSGAGPSAPSFASSSGSESSLARESMAMASLSSSTTCSLPGPPAIPRSRSSSGSTGADSNVAPATPTSCTHFAFPALPLDLVHLSSPRTPSTSRASRPSSNAPTPAESAPRRPGTPGSPTRAGCSDCTHAGVDADGQLVSPGAGPAFGGGDSAPCLVHSADSEEDGGGGGDGGTIAAVSLEAPFACECDDGCDSLDADVHLTDASTRTSMSMRMAEKTTPGWLRLSPTFSTTASLVDLLLDAIAADTDTDSRSYSYGASQSGFGSEFDGDMNTSCEDDSADGEGSVLSDVLQSYLDEWEDSSSQELRCLDRKPVIQTCASSS